MERILRRFTIGLTLMTIAFGSGAAKAKSSPADVWPLGRRHIPSFKHTSPRSRLRQERDKYRKSRCA